VSTPLDVEDPWGEHLFLFGGRPSSADFVLHGQLVQVEPPSMALAREHAPRVMGEVLFANEETAA
jgi:hypothetical protein